MYQNTIIIKPRKAINFYQSLALGDSFTAWCVGGGGWGDIPQVYKYNRNTWIKTLDIASCKTVKMFPQMIQNQYKRILLEIYISIVRSVSFVETQKS